MGDTDGITRAQADRGADRGRHPRRRPLQRPVDAEGAHRACRSAAKRRGRSDRPTSFRMRTHRRRCEVLRRARRSGGDMVQRLSDEGEWRVADGLADGAAVLPTGARRRRRSRESRNDGADAMATTSPRSTPPRRTAGVRCAACRRARRSTSSDGEFYDRHACWRRRAEAARDRAVAIGEGTIVEDGAAFRSTRSSEPKHVEEVDAQPATCRSDGHIAADPPRGRSERRRRTR